MKFFYWCNHAVIFASQEDETRRSIMHPLNLFLCMSIVVAQQLMNCNCPVLHDSMLNLSKTLPDFT